MDKEDEAEAGDWRSADERDRPLTDHFREHPGRLLVGAAILALIVGVTITVRPFGQQPNRPQPKPRRPPPSNSWRTNRRKRGHRCSFSSAAALNAAAASRRR